MSSLTAEDQYFETQAREFAENRADVIWDQWDEAKVLCESPIERRLLAALMNAPEVLEGSIYASVGPLPDLGNVQRHGVQIIPQHVVGRYRIDLAVIWWRSSVGQIRLAVECDGHDFHEKTKDQARRDKLRDRELLTAGWPVMRFTGSEIFTDAARCASDVGNALFETWVARMQMLFAGRRL